MFDVDDYAARVWCRVLRAGVGVYGDSNGEVMDVMLMGEEGGEGGGREGGDVFNGPD